MKEFIVRAGKLIQEVTTTGIDERISRLIQAIARVEEASPGPEHKRALIALYDKFAPGMNNYEKAVKVALSKEFDRLRATPEEIETVCKSIRYISILDIKPSDFITVREITEGEGKIVNTDFVSSVHRMVEAKRDYLSAFGSFARKYNPLAKPDESFEDVVTNALFELFKDTKASPDDILITIGALNNMYGFGLTVDQFTK